MADSSQSLDALPLTEKIRANLPVVVIVGLLMGTAGAAYAVGGLAQRLNTDVANLRNEVTATQTLVKTEYMSLALASEQALRTALANPGLRVADPRNPGKYFFVEPNGPGTSSLKGKSE